MESPAVALQTGFLSFELSFRTREALDFVDITEDIVEHIADAGVENGIAVISSTHTTAAIIVNEHEPELLKDLRTMLKQLAPEHGEYAHNEVPCGPEELPNGHAHCRALLLGASTTIPIVSGQLLLGRYQRVFLVELDHARFRTVVLSILGV